jgi:hypothetical protein
MKRFLALAAVAAVVVPANAVVLYTNTTETASRFNPGLYKANSTDQAITFDDCTMGTGTYGAGNSLQITRITVGIRRLASAPAVDVSAYWADNTNPAPGGFVAGTPNFIGTNSLLVNGASAVTQQVVFGDGVNTMFTVTPNETAFAGFGTFFVGVKFSNNNANNGWRITNGPDANVNAMVLYDPTDGDQGIFGFGSTGPAATFWLKVEGNAVPEPGTIAAIAAGLAAIAARRFRK